jgi:hypothetical protein
MMHTNGRVKALHYTNRGSILTIFISTGPPRFTLSIRLAAEPRRHTEFPIVAIIQNEQLEVSQAPVSPDCMDEVREVNLKRKLDDSNDSELEEVMTLAAGLVFVTCARLVAV